MARCWRDQAGTAFDRAISPVLAQRGMNDERMMFVERELSELELRTPCG
jgi:hypothetical protein